MANFRQFPVILLLLPLAGCMSSSDLASKNALEASGDRLITCQAGVDCEAKWQRAGQWVKANSAYPITSQSDDLIQTAGPDGLFDSHLGLAVTKKPDFEGTPPDTCVIALFPRCDNWLGCTPSKLEAKARFATFVIGSPPAPKPTLGVKVTAVTPEVAQKMQMPDVQGVGITNITPGSLAEKAGLFEGDIIVHYDGKPILTEEALTNLVYNTPPGHHVVLDILRGRVPQSITVDFPPAPHANAK